MMESLKQMRHVIQQLLLFAKPGKLNLMNISLEEAVERAILLVHHQLERRKIEVKRDGSGNNHQVTADPHSLTQILVNLLMNAADSMPDGGVLSIEIQQGNNRVYLLIRDTGSGIEEEHLEKIWEPFFTTKEVGKGTGLGLSVTKKLVEEMSGTITVTSEKGKGTECRLTFPAAVGGQQ
jgi:signal transduction histidine kinase